MQLLEQLVEQPHMLVHQRRPAPVLGDDHRLDAARRNPMHLQQLRLQRRREPGEGLGTAGDLVVDQGLPDRAPRLQVGQQLGVFPGHHVPWRRDRSPGCLRQPQTRGDLPRLDLAEGPAVETDHRRLGADKAGLAPPHDGYLLHQARLHDPDRLVIRHQCRQQGGKFRR